MKTGSSFTEKAVPSMKMWEGRKYHLSEDVRFLHRLLTGERMPSWYAYKPERLDEYRIGAETFLMELECVDNETELEILEPKTCMPICYRRLFTMKSSRPRPIVGI